ncbi:MAG: hypothetical protein HYY87_03710 [Candidatus Levybacteria bacterium]|nr:hypothetical protein [Candidatus Levybacteria bacterium]MBI3092793.1 hypothetical protein [Candidatus Levybacteria bacterium]
MTLLREAARSSIGASEGVVSEKPGEVDEFPSMKIIREQAMRDLKKLFSPEPYVTEWQMSPNMPGPRVLELSFGTHVRDGRLIEHPYSRIIKRLALDHWDRIDTSFDSKTQTGELRWGTSSGNTENIVSKFTISDRYEPEMIIFLGDDLEGSRQRVDDVLGAMELAVRDEVDELKGKQDSFSREQLYVLQTAKPFSQASYS